MGLDPFSDVNPFVRALDRVRGQQDQTRENSARHCNSYSQLTSHGIGEILHETVIPFDCTFVELPRVAYGCSVDGDVLVDGSFPTSVGIVWKWQQDFHDFYLGAYVYFVVTGPADIDLVHDFTFSGIAIKDLPEHLLED